MVVQHNLTAMNSNRMLGVTTSAQAKSSEKLSSGYRINRAADDAAGLTISEKMRKQMRGLDRASTNAQDGVSAVQTAEGALTEVHSMLQRMNELANQASNGTNSESDRSAIQDEISQLTTEIDRVAETTKFNETYLLKGNADGTSSEKTVNAHDAGLAGKLVDNGDGTSTFKLDKELKDGDKVMIAGKNYTIGSKEASTDGFMKAATLKDKKVAAGDSITCTDTTGKTVTKTIVDKVANANALYQEGMVIKIGDKDYTISGATDLTQNELVNTDAEKLISDALAAGQKVTITKTGTADPVNGLYIKGTDVNIDIVSSLDGDTEISSLTMAVAAKGAATVNDLYRAASTDTADLKVGSQITLSGKSITATAEEPANMSTVKEVVKQLQAGDKFTVGDKKITIGDKTDFANNTFTIDDALTLINDQTKVKFEVADIASTDGKSALTASGLKDNTDYTVVESKIAGDGENVLSVKDAYSKMAEELAKASSIGADTAATVKSNNSGEFTIKQGSVEVKDALAFNLHVGADADMTNKINVDIQSMSAAGLGIKGINVSDDSGVAGTYAIDAIQDAIEKVSSQRSALGAVQNRLEHTIANLDNVVENTTAAESRIRDTDMAEEMVNYSKNNILAQAGQSMLAQANQSNQGVLSLLQ